MTRHGAAPERESPDGHLPAPELATIGRVELIDWDSRPGSAVGPCAPGSMLLLHGFGDDKARLRPLGDALCPEGAVAVYPSLRAHGRSPAPEWGYSPLDFAADVQRIFDALPQPVHVVGYSYGALVAAVLAVTLGPQRIASVVLLDQSFEPFRERYEADEWAEASFLKWTYDYSHLLDAATALQIPVLSVIARDSPVVPAAERARTTARRNPLFFCAVTEGTHASFLRDSAVGLVADFYRTAFAEPPGAALPTTHGEVMQSSSAVLHIGWMARAVTALVRTGRPVTCVVKPSDAAAARAAGARTVVVPDPTSTTDVLAGLARQGQAVRDFATVCSGLEFCLLNAAVLADLGRPGGQAFRRALGMRDKFVQKQLVRAAGVRTAACAVVDDLDALDPATLEFPLVLKPLDGGGVRNTWVLSDPDAFRATVARAVENGSGPWLVEEFVPGTEFKVDGLVRDGEIRLLSVSRYLQNLIEVHDGGLVAHVVLSPDSHPELYALTRAVARTAFEALELRDGVFHLEVFQHAEDGEIVFGECAARVGGGRTDEVVKRAYGIDLHDEWARVALGLPGGDVGGPSLAEGAAIGGMNLPAAPGLLRSVPTADEVLARPGVVYAEVAVAAGTVMPDATVASNLRAGLAVVTGPDEHEVERRLRELAEWFAASVRLDPATVSQDVRR
ncbi:alpha/beta fold hydrolase [Kitasatospora sp. MAP5-34]|uniref:alpha/beta fold hydrolase n=1 Tax=Kitasatospora sp. MAP5-34 TaxID=3035102 RepID=UPI002476E666|nr:alpha/beta fold hydrolase [Kitasatospora sp. MAP5-34]MDH6578821.1 pimeloyl-ACP methyl ester carboxylesterase [Kitasatospora sp. MAP5-34]